MGRKISRGALTQDLSDSDAEWRWAPSADSWQSSNRSSRSRACSGLPWARPLTLTLLSVTVTRNNETHQQKSRYVCHGVKEYHSIRQK